MSWRTPISFLATALLAASCTSGSFRDAQEAWKSSNIASYQMTYTSSCGESGWITYGPVTVDVAGDTVDTVAGRAPMEVATVDKLFDVIHNAETHRVDRLVAEYGEFGQPLVIDLDWEIDAIDDEFCIEVTAFDVLREGTPLVR